MVTNKSNSFWDLKKGNSIFLSGVISLIRQKNLVTLLRLTNKRNYDNFFEMSIIISSINTDMLKYIRINT